MDIQRVNTYQDERFPKEILLQHGAFIVDGNQLCMFEIIDHCSAIVYFNGNINIRPVIDEFRNYAEHITTFYDKNHNKICEYPRMLTKTVPLELIQPSQFFVDVDKVKAVSTFLHQPEDVIIPVTYDNGLGKYLSLDGHSRMYHAFKQGWKDVNIYETTPGSYIAGFVEEARRRGVFRISQIMQLSHQEYIHEWYSFCDEFFARYS